MYFDRVHNFIPILNVQKYLSWSHSSHKTEAQMCLQGVMWMLAVSASAQPRAIGEEMYHGVRKKLEDLENHDSLDELTDFTQTQAWVLLAWYEFTQVGFGRGWMSTGRVLRRIQLMRLNELDASPEMASQWLDQEERRRVFWLVYSLERVIGLRDGFLPSFGEDVCTASVLTRRPCSTI